VKTVDQELTLDGPATYQIRVPGELDASWSDWVGSLTITVEGEGSPVTTLTGTVDQAALQSVLRRLCSLGLPLISVTCVECGQARRQTAFLTIQDEPFIAPSCLLALPVQHWQGEPEQVSFSAIEDCGKMEGGDCIMEDVGIILTVEHR